MFDDDDAAGVSGLDPLDGGNAHRINNYVTGPPLGQRSNGSQSYNAIGPLSTRPTYDPRYELAEIKWAKEITS